MTSPTDIITTGYQRAITKLITHNLHLIDVSNNFATVFTYTENTPDLFSKEWNYTS